MEFTEDQLAGIVIPVSAILASALVAVVVLGAQLASAKRERRSIAIANVASALSKLMGEGHRRNNGEPHDAELATQNFDAAITQLWMALPRRQRIIGEFLRAELITAYLETDTWSLLVRGSSAQNVLNSWALGYLPTRRVKEYVWYAGIGHRHSRYLGQYWLDRLAEVEAADGTSEGGGTFHLSARLRNKLKRKARFSRPIDPWIDRLDNWRHERW